MANPATLTPFKKGEARARIAGEKGGRSKSKEKKMLKDFAREVLNLPIRTGRVQDIKNMADVKGKNITTQQAIVLAMAQKAMKGDIKAAEFLRDTSGQKPKDEVEMQVGQSEKLADILEQLTGEDLDGEV